MSESSELKLWLRLEGLETCQRATPFAGSWTDKARNRFNTGCLAPLLIGWVTSSKLLNLSGPHLPHLYNGTDTS